MEERPIVSVGLLTYNHEKFIAQAIESVLNQKVNFKYELVIAEDASTDKTREIVIEYQKKYPDIIRLILQEKNVGMKENSNILRRACRGKYRANLEGDDYWYTTDKLQRQVDFLEQNPDYIAIGGDFICVDENHNPCKFPYGDIKYTYCQEEEYTFAHLENWLLFAHTSTMMFRNIFYTCGEDVNKRFDEVQMLGDRRICLFLVMQGRVRHERTIWAVRRVLSKSSTSMTHAVKSSNYLGVNYKWMLEAERYARSEFNYPLDLKNKKDQRWLGSVRLFIERPSKLNYSVMRYIFENCGQKTRYVFMAIKVIIKKIFLKFRENGFLSTLGKGVRKCRTFIRELYYYSRTKENENSNTLLILHSYTDE